jgi:hypothetical protein
MKVLSLIKTIKNYSEMLTNSPISILTCITLTLNNFTSIFVYFVSLHKQTPRRSGVFSLHSTKLI